MMRSLRRQLRAWKQDFFDLWGRLRTFYRIVLGIVIAGAIVVPAPKHFIDPVKAQIAEVEEALRESEVPETVTLPEEDADSQELELKIESFESSMASYRSKMQEAIDARPDFSKANKGPILSQFNDLITRARLSPLEFRDQEAAPPEEEGPKGRFARTRKKAPAPEEPEKKEPLETAVHSYVLAGSFENIRSFLTAVDEFAYPATIEKLRLQLAVLGEEDGETTVEIRPNARPQLTLSFNLKLYFHE